MNQMIRAGGTPRFALMGHALMIIGTDQAVAHHRRTNLDADKDYGTDLNLSVFDGSTQMAAVSPPMTAMQLQVDTAGPAAKKNRLGKSAGTCVEIEGASQAAGAPANKLQQSQAGNKVLGVGAVQSGGARGEKALKGAARRRQ